MEPSGTTTARKTCGGTTFLSFAVKNGPAAQGEEIVTGYSPMLIA